MFCPQCGKPVVDGARFCGNCGATLSAQESPPQPAFQAPPPPQPSLAPRADTGASPGAVATGGLVARVKNILLSPRTEWPVIAAEPKTARDIYLGYVAPLAAIGVVAAFIGMTTVGVTVPLLGTIRTPIGAALIQALLHFALTFVGVFVIAMLVDALAPTFGGQKDPVRALKVTAYSFTAAWVAGIVTIIPMLGFLALLGSLYGLYLLYLGLPVLMRNPPDKSIGYTIVVVICAIVLMFVISIVTSGIVGLLGFGGINALSRSTPAAPDRGTDAAAAVVSKMMGGQSAADQARMKDAMSTLAKAGEQADQAAKAGKPANVDMRAAMNAVGTVMAGGKEVEPVDFHQLKDLLPPSLPGLPRAEASGQSGEAIGMKGSSAVGRYGGGDAEIVVEIADLGSLSGLASLATRFDPKMEKETATGYERTRTLSGQLVHEKYDRQAKSGETTVIVGERFSVTVRGHGVDASQLTGALQAVDLGRLPKLVAAK